MDEHDQPTEPMTPVFFAPSSPTVADTSIPTPIPHEQPFPYQQVPNAYPPPAPIAGPDVPVYPILPPGAASSKGGKRPAGGASPEDADKANQVASSQSKRSAIPLMVGMFFVLVQLLLLVRFVLKLLPFLGDATWIGMLYTVSGVFVLPFRLLLQNLPFSLPNSVELYTLLAILLYGLLSRLLVRFLKALLRSR